MRILHIGKYYYPYAGGMESVVKDLCEGLVSKGHDVTVLCSHDKASFSEEVINGVKVVRVPRLGVIFGQNINPTLVKKLHELTNRCDLVHVHCPNPQAEVLALSLARDIPMVATYHSDVVRQKTLLKFYRPIFKKFLNRVQKIYVPTNNHIKFSKFLPEYENKCELIPFGIREDFLTANDEVIASAGEMRKKHGPYALFVGRLVGYKGIDVLIKAAKDCQHKVLIVGDGPERENLKKLIAEHSLQDKVELLGKVMDNTQFVGLYHGCEFLVLPSITSNENFGVVQLEAMACSKPVITTNLRSGVPAVGEKGKTCLIVEPNDPLQLTKAMQMVFNNPELKKRLGECGRQRFEELYTWQSMIDKQVSSYRKALDIHDIIAKHGRGKKAA